MSDEQHVLSILVEDRPGVLSRIAGLFSGRGFNIASLCVANAASEGLSRITLVTQADPLVIEQIIKQLRKLINVVKVTDLAEGPAVYREMALVKVSAKPEFRAEILRIVDIFRCKVIDVSAEHYTVEVTGDQGKITALLDLLKPMGVKEIARTGVTALSREQRNGN
ncbi:acetolactate synthase, small subunit [Desulfatibacillum aliphaticivorans]|uniref:Acetolactate synthase small subunit n=1 Tax=Desulfatibacillum aliphaticivorans TaxID=218208 RepID=B8FHH9_DESAL|nr:acetolactate synthase small subunit [Desulfatibacillum aliphaticivorans]ACL02267.1 acetolactate synthase, small subunit [Desulfatibacillum aliphaticivorans]